MKTPLFLLSTTTLVVGGCASTPEVQLRYFAPRATTTMTVTQTIRCSTDKRVLVSNSPAAVTSYASDPAQAFTLDTAALRSAWANTELTIDWTDDGRLKAINHTATGQGETIVKAVLGFLAGAPVGGAAAAADACGKIAALAEGDKPVSITYEGTIEHAKTKQAQTVLLQPTAASRAIRDALASLQLPAMSFHAGPHKEALSTLARASAPDSASAWVTLAATASTPLKLEVAGVGAWSGTAIVPTADTYGVPIPRPVPFGKQGFVLQLAESGAVQKLTYNTETGAASAANAAATVRTAGVARDTAAAAALNAEADVIAARERLANCQAKPADCK